MAAVKQWRAYGYTLDNAVNRPGAIVAAESANLAMVIATEVLNTPEMFVAGLPYFYVTHAVEFDPLNLVYPGKIGDDF